MNAERRRAARIPEWIVHAAVSVLLVVLLIRTDWLWEWDQLIYDWQLRFWAREPASDIVIVAVDERSLSILGRWPWSRSVHAHLIDRLSDAGARVIGLDIVFADPDADDPAGDQQLAQAIARSARVVLPVVNEEHRLGGQLVEILPFPPLAASAAALGHVDRQLDQDAIARSAYLKAGLGSPHWPSFALALLQVAEPGHWEKIPGTRRADSGAEEGPWVWTRDYHIRIPYAGPPGQFPRVSLVDVLHGGVPAEQFHDRFVLVGATAAGLGDLLPTPVSGDRQPMPGVEVAANELDTLRRGLAILPLAAGWRAVLTALLVLIPVLLYPRLPRWSLFIGISFLAATVAISLLLLRGAQLWFPPVVALLALVVSFALWSWRRLVQTIRYLNQALHRLHAEPALVRYDRDVNLGEALTFLSQLLPIGGGALLDASGRTSAGWRRWPDAPRLLPPPGGWAFDPPALWTSLARPPRQWHFGVYWEDEQPPNDDAKRLLRLLAERLVAPTPARPRNPVELLNLRIQQVEAATDRLQFLRRFITDTLEHMAHGVLVADGLGRVVMVNARTGEYLGRSERALLHDWIADVLSLLESAGEEWRLLLRRVMLSGETVETAARAPNGKDLLVRITPYPQDAELGAGVLVNLADITALRESERRRQELLAFLSHDLRSPLTSILAVIDIAKLRPQKLLDGNYLASIERNARKTLRLAEDFVQLARAEGIDDSAFSRLDLAAVAIAAVDSVHGQASAKGIEIRVDLPEYLPVRGDVALLERAMTNLISNAVKYSPSGTTIDVGAVADAGADQVQLWVRDTGYGISEHDLPRLFTRFERIRREEHRDETGSGLGLVFVKTVIDRHHGTVEVESAQGRGTCIHIHLPAVTDPR